LVACTTGNETPRSGPAAAPTAVSLTTTDYAFEAPDTIPAGFTTFRMVNNSEQFHMAQLIKLESGRTLDDFLQAYGGHHARHDPAHPHRLRSTKKLAH
jgi:hypothetical protein